MSDTPEQQNEASPVDQPVPKSTMWDTTITLRKIRNWLMLFLLLGFVWYVWQFFRMEWHSKMGGLPAEQSPYYSEIPSNCQKFSDRHQWFTEFPDSLALRIRPIRLEAGYLQSGYGGIRCLGYAVLTGLHMTDPLDADFVDTYTDAQGKPIVRITVEYLQTYSYNPSQRKALKEKEQQ
jgi:hypothetical protein